MKLDTPVFFTDVKSDNEMDLIEKLLFLYSTSCKLRGKVSFVLSEQMISVLAIFFKYGYSSETRDMCMSIFDIDMKRVSSLTFNLKKDGYLVDDLMSKRKKELNKELIALKDFFNSTCALDKRTSLFMINFEKN